MTKRLLVVEDDASVADLLASELGELVPGGVDQVHDGAVAVAMARSDDYALVTLDLMLPGLGGAQLCARLREAAPHRPLLAVTGRSDVIAAVLGMSVGVDDYCLKPFDLAEVRAKAIELLARPCRGAEAAVRDRGALGGVSFDLAFRRILLFGNPVPGISSTEFEVLHFLASNAGTAFPARELMARLWGLHHVSNLRSLGVNFARLKRKLTRGSMSYISITQDQRYAFRPSQPA